MTEIPIAPIKRIIKNTGAIRVSDAAVEELCNILEETAMEIAEQARLLTSHAGRKTIKVEDILLAVHE